MGKKKKTTIGYRYYMGLHMALGRGPLDEIVEIRVGDKTAWAGRARGNMDIRINQPNLFGGDDKEGGIDGTLSILMGAPEQPVHGRLASMLGGLVPAFRGVTTAFFDGLICAMSPYPKPWAYRARRTLNDWAQGAPWYPEKAGIVLGVPKKLAVYFALDLSDSMKEPIPGRGNRLDVEKAEVIDCLREIARNVISAGSAVDLMIAGYSSGSPAMTMAFRSASESDVNQLVAFVDSMQLGSSTDWRLGLAPMPEFFAGSDPAATQIAFFLTDGFPFDGINPPEWIAQQSADIVKSLPAAVTVHAINIDLDDTQYTAYVDNSGGAIPVVNAASTGELARSILMRVGNVHAMNPAHILYQAYTDPRMGRGLPVSRIDDETWRAAADVFFAEGMGLCLKWSRSDTIEKFAQTVIDHCGAAVFTSRRTGKIVLLPIRGNYDPADIPLFDYSSGLLGIDEDESPAPTSSVNEVIVKYRDPVAKREGSVRAKNLGAIHASGGITNTSSIEYFGLPTASLAARVAQRELKASSGYVKRFKVRLDRRAGDLFPGGLLRVSDLTRGIDNLVLRVGSCDYGTNTDGTIQVVAVQDVFGLPSASFVEPEPPGYVPPNTLPMPIVSQRVMETPYRDLAQIDEAKDLPDGAGYLMALAKAPSSLSLGFSIASRLSPNEFEVRTTQGDFSPSSTLELGISKVDDTVHLLQAVPSDVKAGTAALIGDEIVRIESFDQKTLRIGRGCADTVPSVHAAGARIWFYEDSLSIDPTEYLSGLDVDVKLLTKTNSGQLDEVAAVNLPLSFRQRAQRPYPPGKVRFNDQIYPSDVFGPLAVTFAHRSRLLQADQLIDTESGSVGPEPGTTYRISVYSGQVLLRTYADVQAGWVYAGSDAMADGAVAYLRLVLHAERDGLLSLQAHEHALTRHGLGFDLGASLGGLAV